MDRLALENIEFDEVKFSDNNMEEMIKEIQEETPFSDFNIKEVDNKYVIDGDMSSINFKSNEELELLAAILQSYMENGIGNIKISATEFEFDYENDVIDMIEEFGFIIENNLIKEYVENEKREKIIKSTVVLLRDLDDNELVFDVMFEDDGKYVIYFENEEYPEETLVTMLDDEVYNDLFQNIEKIQGEKKMIKEEIYKKYDLDELKKEGFFSLKINNGIEINLKAIYMDDGSNKVILDNIMLDMEETPIFLNGELREKNGGPYIDVNEELQQAIEDLLHNNVMLNLEEDEVYIPTHKQKELEVITALITNEVNKIFININGEDLIFTYDKNIDDVVIKTEDGDVYDFTTLMSKYFDVDNEDLDYLKETYFQTFLVSKVINKRLLEDMNISQTDALSQYIDRNKVDDNIITIVETFNEGVLFKDKEELVFVDTDGVSMDINSDNAFLLTNQYGNQDIEEKVLEVLQENTIKEETPNDIEI